MDNITNGLKFFGTTISLPASGITFDSTTVTFASFDMSSHTYSTPFTNIHSAKYTKPVYITGSSDITSIISGKGNDTLVSKSTTSGATTLNSAAGNDCIVAGEGSDLLNAGAGNDTLIGGSGNNIFNAGTGNDYISVGAGTNFLTLGSGADTLFIDPDSSVFVADYKYSQKDKITLTGNLTIQDSLTSIVGSDLILTAKNSSGASAYVTLKGAKTQNIDINGNASVHTNAYEKLLVDSYYSNGTLTTILNSDVKVTSSLTSYINGSKLKNPVTLTGGQYVNSIVSGAGDDSINVGSNSNSSVQIVVNTGKGNDSVWAGSGINVPVIVNGGAGADYLVGASVAASLNGGADNDTLVGGSNPNFVVTLTGGAGKDLFKVSSGGVLITDYVANQDSIQAGITSYTISDNDIILHTTLTANTTGGNITVKGGKGKKYSLFDPSGLAKSAQYYGATTVTLANTDDSIFNGNEGFNSEISVVNASSRSKANSINITGNSLDQTIKAGKGDDTISAGVGHNKLTGGSGADLFIISGNDTITDFTPGTDRIQINGTLTGGRQVQSSGDGTLIFTYNYTSGNSTYNTTFTLSKASNGKKIEMYDKTGTISAYYGANPAKLFDSDKSSYNMVTLASDSSSTTDNDLLKNAKAVSAASRSASINIIGGQNTTTITGGRGGDSLTGYKFTDTTIVKISGGNGNDTIKGQSGHDYLSGDAGDDVLYASSLASGSASTMSVYVTKTRSYTTVPLINTLNGGAGKDTLYGSATTDYMLGGAGADVIYGNAGNNTIDGGAGDDSIYAGTGADYIIAGAGNDSIYTGSGTTTIATGAGKDVIIFEGNNAKVYLTDYTDGSDAIYLGSNYSVRSYQYNADDSKNNYADLQLNLYKGTEAAGSVIFKNAAKVKMDTASSSIESIQSAQKITLKYDNPAASTDSLASPFKSTTMTYGLTSISVANADVEKGGTLKINDFIPEASGKYKVDVIDASKRGSAYGIDIDGNGIDYALTLKGGSGADTLTGGTKLNYLIGGSGADYIVGKGTGNTITGGKGNDSLTGVANVSDTFVYNSGDGIDTITNFDTNDIIQLGSGVTSINYIGSSVEGDTGILKIGNGAIYLPGVATGNVVLHYATSNSTSPVAFTMDDKYISVSGGAGNGATVYAHSASTIGAVTVKAGSYFIGSAGIDTIYGTDSSDTIYAGAGNDVITTNGNLADLVYGEAGDDSIVSTSGNDCIYGGAGNDTIHGGNGSNRLYGDAGKDFIYSGTNTNYIDSGAGNDTISIEGGTNTILMSKNGGNDIVYNFNPASDTILLDSNITNIVKGKVSATVDSDKVNYVLTSGNTSITFASIKGGSTIKVEDNDGNVSSFKVPTVSSSSSSSSYIMPTYDIAIENEYVNTTKLFTSDVEPLELEDIIPVSDIDYAIVDVDTDTYTLKQPNITSATSIKDKKSS